MEKVYVMNRNYVERKNKMTFLEIFGIAFLATVIINIIVSFNALKVAANNDDENLRILRK